MTSSYYSKARSTQNKSVIFFFYLGHGVISPSLVEAKVSSVYSDLTAVNFVDIQRLHENIK